MTLVLNAVANPDEVYVDAAGTFHVLKRFSDDVSDFLVVVYFRENREGYKNGFLHELQEEK